MKRLDTKSENFALSFQKILADRGEETQSVAEPVKAILADVKARGDAALCNYTSRFDHFTLTAETIRITPEEISHSAAQIAPETKTALELAARRIRAFHQAQLPQNLDYTDEEGLRLGMRWTPLDAVGLYVPGGKAAYPSSVLMNALPARVAGVKRLAMCVPTPGGLLNPLVMAAAQLCNIEEIYRIGGAQAIGALAYGTGTITPVDRIVGPGNAYVAEAKRQIFGHVGIDSIAGPSEVVVVADGRNNPHLVAIDLMAQAEHDEQAQAILVTTDPIFADQVEMAVEQALKTLKRAAIAQKSWDHHGVIITTRNDDEIADIVNRLAPEHLEILIEHPRKFSEKIRHAGAIFMGPFCPEALGDYVGGPNHVLPTSRTARFASGLSVFDFLKRTTSIETDEKGLQAIGPSGVILAHEEGLEAHALSLSERLKLIH